MTDNLEQLAIENRRLRGEAKQLRGRVAAFERSRWWRLHPRFLLRRLRPAVSGGRNRSDQTGHHVATSSAEADPRIARFRDEIVARGSFSKQWFMRIPSWDALLMPLEGRAANILEIGSFQGLSACYVLWRLRDASITCVDTFAGSLEDADQPHVVAGLEQTFDDNIKLVDASRVRKIVGDSRRVLLDLADEAGHFDFIYVDGSHLGLDVIVDAALAWPLLADDGILVFDDYMWTTLGLDPLRRPGPAIDAFLSLIEGKHDLLWRDSQLGLRKRA
jgi:predicted O-methyltransferase YrrM